MIKAKAIEIVLMACSPAENRQGEEGDQNTQQRTRYGKPERNIPV
jgi:hypothetical protein